MKKRAAGHNFTLQEPVMNLLCRCQRKIKTCRNGKMVLKSMICSHRRKSHPLGEAPRPIKIYDCQNPRSRRAMHIWLGGILTYSAALINEEKSGRSQFYAARASDESALQMSA
jgi:hypothetical protein